MSERLKRALLIIGFLIVTAVLGFLIYWLFFRVPPSEVVPTPTPGAFGQLPGTKTGAPTTTGVTPPGALPSAPGIPQPAAPAAPAVPSRTTVLNASVTQAVSLSPTGGIRSYDPNDGKFYRIKDDGTRQAMTDQVFYNVDSVTWGNKTDQAILQYPDGSKIYYDFNTNKQVTLPKHWENFTFAPQDDRIAAKSVGTSVENRFLVTAKPDGTDAKLIEDMGNNQDRVETTWSPNNQVIAFSHTGQALGFDRQEILLVGQNHENFKGLIVEGRGFQPEWSPSGNTLLYSVYSSADGFRPSLWVSGASGDSVNANRRNLQINTWANKCSFQGETTLYCAVPQSLGEGAGLQPSLFTNTPDSIYRIDLSTGAAVNLGTPDGNPSINHLMVSSDGSYVYYNDNLTGQLSRFAL